MFEFTAFFNESDVYINNSRNKYMSNEILTKYLTEDLVKDILEYAKKIDKLLPHLFISKDMDYDDILNYPKNVNKMNGYCVNLYVLSRKLPPYSDINEITDPDLFKTFMLDKCVLLADEWDHLNKMYEDKGISLPDDEEFRNKKRQERYDDPLDDEDDLEDYYEDDGYDCDDFDSPLRQAYWDFCRSHFYVGEFPDDEDDEYEYDEECEDFRRELLNFIDPFITFAKSAYNSVTFFDSLIRKYLTDRETFMDDDTIAKLLQEALEKEQKSLKVLKCNMSAFEYKMLNDKKGKPIFCEQISFNDIGSFIYYDFFYGLRRRHYPAICKNCGKYYLLTSGKYTKYCDRPLKEDPTKTCLSIGARQRYDDKCKTDPIWIAYNRAYKQHYARMMKKKMTKEELLAWTEFANGLRDKVIAGEIELEEYQREIRK